MKKRFLLASLVLFMALPIACSDSDSGNGNPDPTTPTPTPDPGTNEVDFWLTKSDQSVLLAKQTTVIGFGTTPNNSVNIDVSDQAFQTIDGFGYTLTGGSAQVINAMTGTAKQQLLQDLFGSQGIGVSYLRVSIGASDLSASPYTYNDLPSGQTDTDLSEFSLTPESGLIALLKEILAINPNIKIMATPWSAPLWMKDVQSFVGGHLRPEYYGVYADYFVKYIQQMQAEGIRIDAVTPQNEPLHGGNNPSMEMSASQQNAFIKNNLGPAFQAAGIATKIIVYDHNCDVPGYPLEILNDPVTKGFVDGSAFHLYAGNISALSTVHNAHPDKNVYFTEQYTGATGDFGGDLKWHLNNVVIGSMRNWSRIALEWNLATDPSFGPHTQGGCDSCKGAITITSSTTYTKNVAYYIIAHASKFVPAGSTRISSTTSDNLASVAFKTPDNKKVLVVMNNSTNATSFNIRYNNEWATAIIPAGSVGTYIW